MLNIKIKKIIIISGGGEKGISLLFAVLISSVILAIAFGISGILIQQSKMMGEIGYSIVSFYAADSGVEAQLYELYKVENPQPTNTGTLGEASFETTTKCGKDVKKNDCFSGFEIDKDCDAANFCLKSTGMFKDVKRAMEIKY